MAFVGVLLVLLLMGIMAFGYLMSFRQNMVQAATEGARAGAVAAADPANQIAIDDAKKAAKDAVSGFGKECDTGGLTCVVTVDWCSNATTVRCVTVHLTYDYENHPLLPDIPVIGGALPDTIEARAVAEVNT
jgi:Flp pilus assembly protein TadG